MRILVMLLLDILPMLHEYTAAVSSYLSSYILVQSIV